MAEKRNPEGRPLRGRALLVAVGLLVLPSAAAPAWAGTTERVSVSSGDIQAKGRRFGSVGVAISASGRFVAFASGTHNLVPGDTNEAWDVFVRDREAGTTERVSIGPGGVQGNHDSGLTTRMNASAEVAISGNGRFVAFISEATNLVPSDTNGVRDVFVR